MRVALLYFVKHRLRIAPSPSVRPFDLSFLWTRTFLFFELGNIIEALGFFLPTIYLRIYTSETLGTSNLISSLTIILFNRASIFGCFYHGHHGRSLSRHNLHPNIDNRYYCCRFPHLRPFAQPGASSSFFCIVYGIFAGSFSSTWPAIMKEVQKQKNSAESTIVCPFLVAERSIGNMVSGPFSKKLSQGFPGATLPAGRMGAATAPWSSSPVSRPLLVGRACLHGPSGCCE